jgi:DNA-binding transcriptional regulator YiaG
MTDRKIINIQAYLGMSDRKLALALGVQRQTVRNWRIGRPCPVLAQNALRWMLELRRLDPANDNLPQQVKVKL